jgi:hypothetical protein
MIYDGAVEKALFDPMNVVWDDTLIVRKDFARPLRGLSQTPPKAEVQDQNRNPSKFQ